jgi:ribosomal protein S3
MKKYQIRPSYLNFPLCRVWIKQYLKNEPYLVKVEFSQVVEDTTIIIYALKHISTDKNLLITRIKNKFLIANPKLEFRLVPSVEYPIESIIANFIIKTRSVLTTIVIKELNKVLSRLQALKNLNGYVITIAGKLYGARHVRKKFEFGTNKYTGSYLDDLLVLKCIQIETPQGIIGIKFRIMYNQYIPGRFLINPLYMVNTTNDRGS